MKIFTTQLQGIFQKIQEQEDMNIEDAARLLAQAVIGDGNIYIYGNKEMEGILLEALYGPEPLPSAAPLFKNGKMADVSEADRILLVSRFSTDKEVVDLAKKLKEQGIQTVGISAVSDSETSNSLEQWTDIHIDIKLVKPLIPDEAGNRFGFPSLMAALYAYYVTTFTMKEILEDYV
jgi:uncharacterized phosphosugar-binding protein